MAAENMLKKYLIVSAVAILFVIYLFGFAMAKSQQQEVANYVANFNYTPASQEASGSGGVTFAIGNVNYTPTDVPSALWMQELVAIKKVINGKLSWFLFSQFDSLAKSTRDDLSKLFLAKGFSVRGPFDSYDLIPYSDKKAIDLYIIPKLVLSFTLIDEKWSATYYSTGNVAVNGNITLELREIVTSELMWTKSIPLTKFEFPYSIHGPYHVEKKFNLIMNDVIKGIEQQYPNLMATVSKLIDPEEMRIIKKQCQELKSKKGY